MCLLHTACSFKDKQLNVLCSDSFMPRSLHSVSRFSTTPSILTKRRYTCHSHTTGRLCRSVIAHPRVLIGHRRAETTTRHASSLQTCVDDITCVCMYSRGVRYIFMDVCTYITAIYISSRVVIHRNRPKHVSPRPRSDGRAECSESSSGLPAPTTD